ncbi:hypothetical protein GLOTRDRAFT_74909 [Gloeophyllum trabeum ATCC 11539]|uniref:F-box only protein 9 n=1 Tax=Gloeophyllum trabeum (strain ATCC 11539 / FP-39264 / Madison 617) TaxID=670483 RepID=S7Q9X1_GLOTA|nr:uncharacterized protein GLOTRDRAFT_74909 [Gloeophyllum trabeum ATCC 11539]EPQ56317.1 hypothetical protein GLOTRDRAFT_74909 [Gloeophyllum trabeum ATCC 11539]
MQRPPPAATDEEPEELKRFRDAWRAEVQRKKAQTVQSHLTSDLAPLGRALQSAVDVYRRAIQNEQSGDLDEALRLYRQAFRMDDNVDKAYRKAEKLQELRQNSQGAVPPATETRPDAPEPSIVVIDDKALDLSALSISADTKGAHGVHAVVTGTIASLLESFPKELRFEPEDERRTLHLNKVPDELLIHILRYLDHTTIERFAAVDKKARVVSLDSVIWRDFVYETYKPPQVPHEKYMKAMMQRYLHDYRRAFIEQPRLRLDGVYIAVCHYVRAGLSQNAWVNVSHLITYHRFLRFFPNGQVISLLANEEVEPQQVIPLLKPTLRMKGVTVGNWRLEGTTVYITDLIDPASLELNASARSKRYAFQMTLALRSRPLGRWNKLDIAAYETVNIETGETDLLPLKHERPFWFSKVRSYASY